MKGKSTGRIFYGQSRHRTGTVVLQIIGVLYRNFIQVRWNAGPGPLGVGFPVAHVLHRRRRMEGLLILQGYHLLSVFDRIKADSVMVPCLKKRILAAGNGEKRLRFPKNAV